MRDQYPDLDGDNVPDEFEISGFMGAFTATNHPDTYNTADTVSNPKYAVNGDEELRCTIAEKNNTIPFHPERDWANPGCQHRNQCGPRPSTNP